LFAKFADLIFLWLFRATHYRRKRYRCKARSRAGHGAALARKRQSEQFHPRPV